MKYWNGLNLERHQKNSRPVLSFRILRRCVARAKRRKDSMHSRRKSKSYVTRMLEKRVRNGNINSWQLRLKVEASLPSMLDLSSSDSIPSEGSMASNNLGDASSSQSGLSGSGNSVKKRRAQPVDPRRSKKQKGLV